MKAELEKELLEDILPFWENLKDSEGFGFWGQVTGESKLVKDADKGAILHARILWTFSKAYSLYCKPEYLDMARHAKDAIVGYFYDPVNGGVYWNLSADGVPLDKKKQIYAQAFAIYSLAEYYIATSDISALDYARKLFELIERFSFDEKDNGYTEAFAEDWTALSDMRLSDKDKNECKTMNTHLHILEAYANLYRVWKDPLLENRLSNLISVFKDRILNPEINHLGLYFNNRWENRYSVISYGHDIEASWLVYEACSILGHRECVVDGFVKSLASAAKEGIMPDGSMVYEKDLSTGESDKERHWWVQAETVVGFFNIWDKFKDEEALRIAMRCWYFIRDNMIDRNNGEWFWSVNTSGEPNLADDKAGFWKCPYHNSRMCFEIISRLKSFV